MTSNKKAEANRRLTCQQCERRLGVSGSLFKQRLILTHFSQFGLVVVFFGPASTAQDTAYVTFAI